MALKSIKKIDIDFYNQKYILVNAKQNDKYSRFLEATCYNRGELFSLNPNNHSAFIRYRKADEYGVFNKCNINYDGTIVIEFTEQMLAVAGMCYADLVVIDNGYAEVNPDTGEIVGIEDTAILSTMTFCVDVVETAVENSEFESTYEFDNLNKILEEARANFQNVILTAKSWAVGDTDIEGRKNIEDTDNAKYYANKAEKNMKDAETYKNSASTSATGAAKSATSASSSSQKASASESAAREYSITSQRYAVGGTNTVSGENTDNAKYYYNESLSLANSANTSAAEAAQSAASASSDASKAKVYSETLSGIIDELNGAFLPMGTINYEDLAILKSDEIVKVGFVYNINNDFVTDDTFKDGSGVEYTAGTNVYYTADGYWDCLVGSAVTGIKGSAEDSYRKGSVNITAENVGAIPSSDIAAIDEVKSYLGI